MKSWAWNTREERAAALAVRREIRSKHPRLRKAIAADARLNAAYRAERYEYRSSFDTFCQVFRLMWVTDAFFAQVMYRFKARWQALHIPILPRIAHRLAMASAQVCIGDPVVIHPGMYIAHGQVVIDGFVEVHSGAVIFPWVTIGTRAGNFQGPTIEADVHIGTGAKVIGPITVGAGTVIGANAVVVDDVPSRVTVAGMPAKVIGESRPNGEASERL